MSQNQQQQSAASQARRTVVQARRAGGQLLGDAAGGGQRGLHLALPRGPEGRLLLPVPVQACLAAAGRPGQRDVVPRVVRPARMQACIPQQRVQLRHPDSAPRVD